MLVNIIQNTISSFISAGVAAAEVITTNLKMWLGFETSETLGRELVVNGDFATDSDWTTNDPTSWTISNDKANSDGTQLVSYFRQNGIVNLTSTYKVEFTVSGSTSGTLNFLKGNGSTAINVRSNDTYTFYAKWDGSTGDLVFQSLNFVGSVSNVSVKELTQITPDKSDNNNVGELFTGKALEFDGSNDYVNTTGFEMSGTSATFAFWIYPKDTAYQFVMDLDGTVRTILGLFNGGSGQVFAFFNFGFKQFGTPTQNQWQRVVFRVNATTVECYVDGVKSGSTLALTSSIDLSTVGNSVIGGRFDTTNTGNRFDGSLSDFQIYNAYWSTDDIAYDYANPQNLVTDRDGTSIGLSNLKGYWALSEGAGSLTYDSSGEGNNGTINGATYEPAQPRIPQLGMMNWAKSTPVVDEITLIPNPNNTSQDILGNAVRDRLNSFNLDGSGYAEVADDADLDFGTGDFSLEVWVKADYLSQGNAYNTILSLGDNVVNGDNAAIISLSNTFRFLCGGNTSAKWIETTNYTQNEWTHLVAVRDSGTTKFYMNTTLQTGGETNNSNITNNDAVLIGKDLTTNRFYPNLISDVRLYKGKALSSTEVENNYNAGLSAHTND